MVYHKVMQKNQYHQYLGPAVEAARLAGEIILDNLGKLSSETIQEKQSSDFVTHVDRESEQAIIGKIRDYFPDHEFLAEESDREDGGGIWRWIIDPLDGTTNYIHGYPVFSVSIALEWKGDVVVGVVYDPLRNELFTAIKGNGSFLNGFRVKVSSVSDPGRSLIATGFPFRKKEMLGHYLVSFRKVFDRVSDIRRAGSAALDLAYIACGRCEGFFELNLSPWDMAAGSLLITEAGGVVTDFGGGREFLVTGNIVAGSLPCHEMLLDSVQSVFRGIVDR